jgi:hypothetical protein
MLFKLDKESITLLNYSVRYEILILIGILYLIIFGHTICSCTRISMNEGFAMQKPTEKKSPLDAINDTLLPN